MFSFKMHSQFPLKLDLQIAKINYLQPVFNVNAFIQQHLENEHSIYYKFYIRDY